MSDMIDKLRGLTGDVGAEVGKSLSSQETLSVMDARVRAGVRRRRTRQSVAGVATAALVAVGVIVVTGLLPKENPLDVDPGERVILHSDGALTVFDDGSMSVVLSSGRIVDVKPDAEAATNIEPRRKVELCETHRSNVEGLGWTWPDNPYSQALLGFGRVLTAPDGGQFSILAQGSHFGDLPDEAWPGAQFELQVDPAVAPYIVVQFSVVEAWEKTPLVVTTRLSSELDIEVQGTGSNTVALVRTGKMDFENGGWCVEQWPEIPDDARIDVMLIADVWLTDRAGTVAKLGTHVTWATFDYAEGRK